MSLSFSKKSGLIKFIKKKEKEGKTSPNFSISHKNDRTNGKSAVNVNFVLYFANAISLSRNISFPAFGFGGRLQKISTRAD